MACFTCDSLEREMKAERNVDRKKEMELELEDHVDQLVGAFLINKWCNKFISYRNFNILIGCSSPGLHVSLLQNDPEEQNVFKNDGQRL